MQNCLKIMHLVLLIINHLIRYMPNYSNLVQVRANEETKNLKLSKEAAEILEVLNELENFTISVRRKVMEEMRSTNPSIHIKIKDSESDS